MLYCPITLIWPLPCLKEDRILELWVMNIVSYDVSSESRCGNIVALNVMRWLYSYVRFEVYTVVTIKNGIF
jgi:hypothetical protein